VVNESGEGLLNLKDENILERIAKEGKSPVILL